MNRFDNHLIGILWSMMFFMSCGDSTFQSSKIFDLKPLEHTNVLFKNTITETDSLNYFTNPNLYMGGGVAIGDVDNDGLQDIFFVGNLVDSKLYRNEGNFKFKDITPKSGIEKNGQWFTGVTMVDINQDGYLDIYLSASVNADKRNKLYINNGDLTFTESSKKYGLDDQGASNQAVFFDYDGDNDLDVYIANYPPISLGTPNSFFRKRVENPSIADSDKLFRNDGDEGFTDVSKESGILNYGLSLGLSVADYNNDGWPDIYVSNDYSTPDYLWINNGDGTFVNTLKESFAHTSLFAMGSDAADYNNDGWIDLVQLDMTPEDNRRSKENMSSMNPAFFWNTVNSGFHYQYMQNCLQWNRGNKSDSIPYFSDVARMNGIATTDWSWAPLFADLDNDGWKDLFITNGTKRDVNNKDYFDQLKSKVNFSQRAPINSLDIPSEPIANYAYKNGANKGFSEIASTWGLDFKGFSNGAAYGDLDNDGDLDLVINNIDTEAGIYENRSDQLENSHYVRFKFTGPKGNRNGIGSRIKVYQNGSVQDVQLILSRGFLSSVEPYVHFGLPSGANIDSIKVIWPDGKVQQVIDLPVDRVHDIKYNTQNVVSDKQGKVSQKFLDVTEDLGLNYVHKENDFSDYIREPLLPHQYSRMGPGISVADVNQDGKDDFFVGNAVGAAAKLFVQIENGEFEELEGPWEYQIFFEDMVSMFFDVDNDGDQDLYVGSGGNEYSEGHHNYRDRLFLNDGAGGFTENEKALPSMLISTGTVQPGDFDGDGDVDLFIGGRVVPGAYPLPSNSYLLQNQWVETGEAIFVDVTEKRLPALTGFGMVTDALWSDYDGDLDLDLIISKEWGPVSVYENNEGQFEDRTSSLGLDKFSGWWYGLAQGDFDGDGDIDFIAGNLGVNYKYQATDDEPFEVYSGDYDRNEKRDIVLGYHQDGNLYPLRGRECSAQQIPAIKRKFKNYESFANASLADVYGKGNLESGLHYSATAFSSSYIENRGSEGWKVTPLPSEAQISSVNKILVKDLNGDSHLDLIIGGNLHMAEVETTRNDASIGLYLEGNGKGQFVPISSQVSGLYLDGDVKDITFIVRGEDLHLIVTRNNDCLKFVKYRKI